MNERIERRLGTLRREFMRAEMLARAIERIASDPDHEQEDLQFRLMEIEAIAEKLVALIDHAAGEMEPNSLKRFVRQAEEGGEDE